MFSPSRQQPKFRLKWDTLIKQNLFLIVIVQNFAAIFSKTTTARTMTTELSTHDHFVLLLFLLLLSPWKLSIVSAENCSKTFLCNTTRSNRQFLAQKSELAPLIVFTSYSSQNAYFVG
jgi:hypothetical protein